MRRLRELKVFTVVIGDEALAGQSVISCHQRKHTNDCLLWGIEREGREVARVWAEEIRAMVLRKEYS